MAFISSDSKTTAPGMGRRRRWFGGRRIFAMVMLAGLPLAAQSPGIMSLQHQPVQDSSDANSPFDARMEAKRMAQLNTMRQKSMVSDADRLLQLAEELQEDADAGGTKMSPAMRMRAAAEIEKLAKNVKDKMIYAIGTPESGGILAVQR